MFFFHTFILFSLEDLFTWLATIRFPSLAACVCVFFSKGQEKSTSTASKLGTLHACSKLRFRLQLTSKISDLREYRQIANVGLRPLNVAEIGLR